MKAIAVFPGTKEIRVIDVPAPQRNSESDVLVRICEVGVCGTDKEIAQFQYGTPPDGSDFLIIGHESLAEVVQSHDSNFKEGDLVVLMVRRPCPHDSCPACRAGRQDFCYTGDFTERGIKSRHGFMTELVVDEARFCFKVPATLRPVAVLTEPLTIAEKALIQVREVQDRLPWFLQHNPSADGGAVHNALILGAGPVGLLGAMVFASAGYRIHVYSLEAAPNPKSMITEIIGGTYFSAKDYSLEHVATELKNIDLIYEATGASGLAFEALKYLGVNGIFIFTGVPGRKAPIEFDADVIMRNLVLNNQVVLGTVNAGADAYRKAIDDLGSFTAKWGDALQQMMTGRFPIDRYADVLTGKAPGIKNVIAFENL